MNVSCEWIWRALSHSIRDNGNDLSFRMFGDGGRHLHAHKQLFLKINCCRWIHLANAKNRRRHRNNVIFLGSGTTFRIVCRYWIRCSTRHTYNPSESRHNKFFSGRFDTVCWRTCMNCTFYIVHDLKSQLGVLKKSLTVRNCMQWYDDKKRHSAQICIFFLACLYTRANQK